MSDEEWADVALDYGEWYPVWSFKVVADPDVIGHTTRCIPRSIVERWQQVFDAFNQVQIEIATLQKKGE